MLSLSKILLVAVVIFAVVAVARAMNASKRRAAARRPAKGAPETLERCPACGVFHAPGDSHDCDRPDCPTRQKS